MCQMKHFTCIRGFAKVVLCVSNSPEGDGIKSSYVRVEVALADARGVQGLQCLCESLVGCMWWSGTIGGPKFLSRMFVVEDICKFSGT